MRIFKTQLISDFTCRNADGKGTEQFMQMNPGLLSGESYDENGNKSLIIERTKEERSYAKKELENNSNPIDLQLYKKN